MTDWLDLQPSSLAISRVKAVLCFAKQHGPPTVRSMEACDDRGHSALDIKFGLDMGLELPPVAERGLQYTERRGEGCLSGPLIQSTL